MGEDVRESKTVQVGTHTIALKTYLTAREGNQLKDMVYSKIAYKTENGESSSIVDMKGTDVLVQELATIKLCVIALDGSTENIVDRLQDDLTTAEYQKVKESVDELTKDLFPTPKKE